MTRVFRRKARSINQYDIRGNALRRIKYVYYQRVAQIIVLERRYIINSHFAPLLVIHLGIATVTAEMDFKYGGGSRLGSSFQLLGISQRVNERCLACTELANKRKNQLAILIHEPLLDIAKLCSFACQANVLGNTD